MQALYSRSVELSVKGDVTIERRHSACTLRTAHAQLAATCQLEASAARLTRSLSSHFGTASPKKEGQSVVGWARRLIVLTPALQARQMRLFEFNLNEYEFVFIGIDHVVFNARAPVVGLAGL